MTHVDMHQPPCRILVVDDDRDSASMLASLLGSQGHDVLQAYDGGEAVKLAGEFQPEIIFLDLIMPAMDGFDVARELRKQERMTTSRTILIALSGFGDAAYREATDEGGFDAHLQKPFDPEELRLAMGQPASGDAQTPGMRRA